MNADEKFELVARNTEEIVTEPELKSVLTEKKNPVAYCGYEVSGAVHLGHLVTITKLRDMENAGFKVTVLLADWHTWLNRKGTWESIRETAKKWEKAFKALGLKNTQYVLGTSFQKKDAYIDDVLTLASEITVNRGLRSMQVVTRDIENARVSQIVYPLMQIADLKHLKIDVSQSGIEQRKIYMLARETIGKINYKKPAFVYTPLVNSLLGPGEKMSSSIPNSMIAVQDSEKDLRSKISRAYCKEGEVEGSPILEIARYVIFPRVETFSVKRPAKFGGNAEFQNYGELEKAFSGKKLHPADLKNAVADHLVEILEPARKAFS